MKGRPMLVNVLGTVIDPGVAGTKRRLASNTFKVTNTNEDIYFSQPEMDDLAEIRFSEVYKSYRDILRFARSNQNYNANWILYSQNIFPSLRNEFISGASRPHFDNMFWRDRHGTSAENFRSNYQLRTYMMTQSNPSTRAMLGSAWCGTNSMFGVVSQSSWVLDPSVHFLTRSHPDNYVDQPAAGNSYYNYRSSSIYNGFAGELQNEYGGGIFETALGPTAADVKKVIDLPIQPRPGEPAYGSKFARLSLNGGEWS